jgi:hypothetical protein
MENRPDGKRRETGWKTTGNRMENDGNPDGNIGDWV